MDKIAKTGVRLSKKNSVVKSTEKDSVTIYDSTGYPVDLIPGDKIMARKTITQGQAKYEVRCNLRGDLYNPFDRMFIEEAYRLIRIENNIKPQLIKTNEKCFNTYLEFLKTKEKNRLNIAQRILL